MEARELRIGNLVYANGKLAKVTLIINERIEKTVRAWQIEDDHMGASDESLSPIPLTEEWLLKMGFIDGCYKNEKEPISLDRYNDSIWNCYLINGDKKEGVLRKIKYLHQLQNLYFTLTNTELTINL